MLRTWKITAISCLLVNSLSALLGGYKFMADPTGISMNCKQEWLIHTPFTNYYIPGLLLFVFIGVFSLTAAFFVVIKFEQYPLIVILQGLILFIWLTTEMLLMQLYHFLYIIYGILMIMLIVSGVMLYRLAVVASKKSMPGDKIQVVY